MASQILSFLHLFGSRTATTSIAPNSWAAICLWRRYFQWKDDQEREQIEAICEVCDIEPPDHANSCVDRRDGDPIQSGAARDAMEQFRRETNHRSARTTYTSRLGGATGFSNQNNASGASTTARPWQHQDSCVLDNPNLSVDGMFIAQ